MAKPIKIVFLSFFYAPPCCNSVTAVFKMAVWSLNECLCCLVLHKRRARSHDVLSVIIVYQIVKCSISYQKRRAGRKSECHILVYLNTPLLRTERIVTGCVEQRTKSEKRWDFSCVEFLKKINYIVFVLKVNF